MTNPTRRSILASLPIGITLLLSSACTQSQVDEFVALDSTIIACIQVALPIGSLFFPGYALLLPEIQTFLNMAGTAAANVANALAGGGTLLAQAQAVVNALTSVVLAPSVLTSLPTSFSGPNGPVNVQALIAAVVNSLNAILTLAAHTAGGAVVPTLTNAVVAASILPAPGVRAKLATTPAMQPNSKQQKKLDAIVDANANIQKSLTGWPAKHSRLVPFDEPSDWRVQAEFGGHVQRIKDSLFWVVEA